MGKDASNPEAP
jgi:small GTP-binding protein